MVGNPEGKRHLDRRRWKNNIKTESKVFLHGMKTYRVLEVQLY
jgi:hypothetical protein